MADENKALVNAIPEHSKIENTDRFLGSGTSEEFLVNLDNLASAVFEKIKSEFGAAAFLKVANNDTTTESGYVADARAVEKLGKEVDAVNSSLENIIIAGDGTGSLSYKYGVLPFEGVIIKNKLNHTAEIHISCKLESLKDNHPENVFGFFDSNIIMNALGATSITVRSSCTRVFVLGVDYNSDTYGRTGLRLLHNSPKKQLEICRAYNDDFNIKGSWGIKNSSVFAVGATYMVDLWNVSYS